MADIADTTAEPCCDLHGRNCEPPGDLCCGDCTEARHDCWTEILAPGQPDGGLSVPAASRARARYGHPPGEQCSNPDLSDA